MNIEEVQQLTGLTEKAIRFYQNEQLVKVDSSDNISQEYNDDTVKQLLEINLYRKLDVKTSDLKRWKNNEVSIENLLAECLAEYKSKGESIDNKTEICKKLLHEVKSGHVVEPESYLISFELLESDEFDQLKKFKRGSVVSQFFFSLIFLGPIAWLFLNYYGLKDYKTLAINIPLALCCTIFLSVSWTNFLRDRDCSIKNILIGIGKLLLYIISFIILIAGIFGMLAFVGFLSEFLFIPKEYLFYTMRTGALVAIIFFLLEFLCIFLLIINFFSHKKGKRIVDIIKPFFKKLWYVLIALNLAMFYFIASSILIISSDKIVNRSILNPRGEQYNYSDIETIRIGMKEDTFYYTLYMRDSKTINLTELGTISDMVDSDNELSYLVKIDKIAMDAGAVKVVSDVDFNNSFYDETGIVNIEKIINNK